MINSIPSCLASSASGTQVSSLSRQYYGEINLGDATIVPNYVLTQPKRWLNNCKLREITGIWEALGPAATHRDVARGDKLLSVLALAVVLR